MMAAVPQSGWQLALCGADVGPSVPAQMWARRSRRRCGPVGPGADVGPSVPAQTWLACWIARADRNLAAASRACVRACVRTRVDPNPRRGRRSGRRVLRPQAQPPTAHGAEPRPRPLREHPVGRCGQNVPGVDHRRALRPEDKRPSLGVACVRLEGDRLGALSFRPGLDAAGDVYVPSLHLAMRIRSLHIRSLNMHCSQSREERGSVGAVCAKARRTREPGFPDNPNASRTDATVPRPCGDAA